MQLSPAAEAARYVDSLGPEALAKAQSYTLGNHWLILTGIIVSAFVTWLIIRSGVLDRVSARLEKRGWALRTFLVAATFLLVDTIFTLPYALYTDWWRETQYGRTSQPLGDFLGQAALSTMLSVLLGGLFLLGVYWLIRKTGRQWWLWGGALTASAIAFLLLVSPALIEPLFNEYKPIPEGEVRDAVLALAAEAGVPEDRVFMYDGSRQSNNFTANVSGVGSTARIAISDVAMGEASLDEVKAVTGHEIGHYVLGHVWLIVAVLGILSVLVLYLVSRLYPWFARKFGTNAELADPRGLPVFMFLFATLLTLFQPAFNSLSRVDESAADAYSLEHVGLPDALSLALIKTAEYRYPRPTKWQEILFYTHPSVENRVLAAMEWKARHPAAVEPATK